MKKIILSFAILLSACGYDTRVEYKNKEALQIVEMEKDIAKQKQVQISLEEYERMQRTNYYNYQNQKEVKCSLGYGYDELGYPCEKNVYYPAYENKKVNPEEVKAVKKRVCICQE